MMGPGQNGGAGKTLQLKQVPDSLNDCWQLSRSGSFVSAYFRGRTCCTVDWVVNMETKAWMRGSIVCHAKVLHFSMIGDD